MPGTGTPSRSDVDIAVGIVVGLRGGTTAEAHDELLGIAKEYGLSLFRLSRALIALASGRPEPASSASDVVRLLWEGMIRERDLAPRPSLTELIL